LGVVVELRWYVLALFFQVSAELGDYGLVILLF